MDKLYATQLRLVQKISWKNILATEAQTICQSEPFLNIHEYFVARN